ncbi:phytanoyl-CoA hydroxylase-interacting protein isoform X1 [Patella vulgata]|uniref:phytanoyl-CoA hydroxylase-interacting protein isoform X1 n=1 Tax=Patella vulgata TaxID=6465 RepID=UPI0024A7E601|nr:phytanoyl-CoA hydroxylase-interacting protein isoform X1 [Patella vulgata]
MEQPILQYTMNIGQRKVKVKWDESMEINILFCAVFNSNTKELYFYRKRVDNDDDDVDNDVDNDDDDDDDDDDGFINDELEFSIYGRNTNKIQLLGSSTFISPRRLYENSCQLKAENLLQRPDSYVPENVETIQVHQNIQVQDGERKKQIVFELTDEPNENLYIQHVVITYKKNSDIRRKQYMELIKTSESEIPWGLSNSTRSRCKITCLFHKVNKVSDVKYFVTNSYCTEFNTHNSTDDVNSLYKKAKEFIKDTGKIPVRYLYRNKPSDHSTIQDMEKTGIMKKYIKDNAGDPCSSINNRIHGLFFAASPDRLTEEPPNRSPYGDYRIMIKPKYLLHVPGLNLYFADLSCTYPDSPHNVTLVLTKRGSTEDRYCQNRLIPLNIEENEFLWYSNEDDQYYTTAHSRLWVELCYTEDIEVHRMRTNGELEIVTKCPVFGQDRSRPEGTRKEIGCKICNLPRSVMGFQNVRFR